VLSVVVNKDLTKKTYDEKINTLLKYNIGLWDVLESCERVGSMDNKILNGRPNNFNSLLKKYPNIKVILILGTQGYDIFRKLKISISQYYIPSTSGANRANYNVAQKAKIILNYIRH
jgi:hypoxanthine-DNA glycosylase